MCFTYKGQGIGFFERDVSFLVFARKSIAAEIDLTFSKRMDLNVTMNIARDLDLFGKVLIDFEVFVVARYMATPFQFSFAFYDEFRK